MKLVSFPYRWLPRTFWSNIRHIYYDFYNGIQNLYTFFEAVWWFRSWDESGLIELIRVSAQEMRKTQEHGLHLHADRYARQLLIVETLCKRMQNDNYFRNAGYKTPAWKKGSDFDRSRIAKHSQYMENQDARYLGKMFKFIHHWWD